MGLNFGSFFHGAWGDPEEYKNHTGERGRNLATTPEAEL